VIEYPWKYLKIKIEKNFSLFAVKLYDLKERLYAVIVPLETQEYSSHVMARVRTDTPARLSQMSLTTLCLGAVC